MDNKQIELIGQMQKGHLRIYLIRDEEYWKELH